MSYAETAELIDLPFTSCPKYATTVILKNVKLYIKWLESR